MPEEIVDESHPEPGSRVFQPMTSPDHPDFEAAMALDVFDITRSRQLHSRKHTPTCFKYRSKRKCRFRMPRTLVPNTIFDEETGVILQKRDHEWLNNYNPWFSIIMRANHDCQYLFTQTHALAIIYYIMKYISKTEMNTYSKLTIAAAVAKAIATTTRGNTDAGKTMLIKTYNKLSSHREVGIPEAISHLLDFPDHFTDGVFSNIHTTHLLNYLKCSDDDSEETSGDSAVVRVHHRTTIVSLFDDYSYRGSFLGNLCLYDYCSLVYKDKKNDCGLPFESAHPQHDTHRQFIRHGKPAIPTLLGKLLFLRPDSTDEIVRNEHFCLVSALFIPWNHDQALAKSPALSWEEFFRSREQSIPPRILRYIGNLALLHKSKEEARVDQLQLRAQFAEEGEDTERGDHMFSGHFDMSDDEDWQDEASNASRSLAVVQSALEASSNSLDEYVQEAMDANCENGYFDNSMPSSPSPDPHFEFGEHRHVPFFTATDLKAMKTSLKTAREKTDVRANASMNVDIQPDVFLTDKRDVLSVIREFNLNKEQTRAFRIICSHALGIHPVEESQLLMGVFGEGGTGKSTLIKAIRVWFESNNRGHELIVTATTGSAAVKVNGSTVHSAVCIPIEMSDGKRVGKLTPKKIDEWTERRYMIIDEVSMLDCKVMEDLHKQLTIAKANPEIEFGGMNIIFFGDFLQLPAVINPDLYRDTVNRRQGHQLWRSLNAVVILKEQMRQAGDPDCAALLSRLRRRDPTDEDIETLNSRIGAKLPNMKSVAVVVRRHALRHAINMRRLRELESNSNTRTIYCVASLSDVKNVSVHQAYRVQFGERGSPVDAILPLLPGVPLMITTNVDRPLGKHSSSSSNA